MSADLAPVLAAVLATVAGLALVRNWLRDGAAVLWMLPLRPALAMVAVLTVSTAIYLWSLILIPREGFAATRVAAIIVLGPSLARGLADALAWLMAPAVLREPVRSVLVSAGLWTGGLLVCTLAVWALSLLAVAGPLWTPGRISLSVVLAALVCGPLLDLCAPLLKPFGEKRSIRDFVFEQAASDQQAAFMATLSTEGETPLGDAGEMFSVQTPSKPTAAPASSAPARRGRRPQAGGKNA